jgi:hypothetical protein
MNSITRMMKWFIKTPLRYALPLLFIGANVLVTISGCVSPATTSPSPAASAATAAPVATATPAATATPSGKGTASDSDFKKTATYQGPYTASNPYEQP